MRTVSGHKSSWDIERFGKIKSNIPTYLPDGWWGKGKKYKTRNNTSRPSRDYSISPRVFFFLFFYLEIDVVVEIDMLELNDKLLFYSIR